MYKKLNNIKAVLTDVDGVLTDGSLIYDEYGNISKKFNVKDGQLVKYILSKGIILGVITGRSDNCTLRRIKDLKIDFYRNGSKNKLKDYEDFKVKYKLKDKEICYIGDDLIDLEVLNKCGFSVSPNDAVSLVKEKVDYISNVNGGDGVFRDVLDLIIEYNFLEELEKDLCF